jgi:hypothetical protein
MPEKILRTLGLAAALAVATPVLAHHSFAMFDQTRTVNLRGVVKDYRWVNPHVSLFVEVSDGPTKHGVWAIELTSPGNLTRLGWSRKSLVPGERVDIEVNPLRDGGLGGGFRKATILATGAVLQARLVEIEKPS